MPLTFNLANSRSVVFGNSAYSPTAINSKTDIVTTINPRALSFLAF